MIARYTCLLLMSGLLFASCFNNDRNNITNHCPESSAFVIDLSTPSFFGLSWFWMNNANQDLVHEELLSGSGSPIQFINYEGACEQRYAVSIGVYNELVSSAGGVTKEVNIEEVGNVPSGLGLDIFPQRIFQSINVFNENSLVTITNCPPIDSVRYVQSTTTLGSLESDADFIYNAADSLLTISPGLAFTRSSVENLAIRLSGTDEWRGTMIPVSNATFQEYEFSELESYPLHTIHFPGLDGSTLILIKYISNINEKQITELAHSFGSCITFPAPLLLDGVLVYVKKEEYEEQTYHTSYPQSIPFRIDLNANEIQLTDNQLRTQTSGGDIIRMVTHFNNITPDADIIGKRTYTTAAIEGLHTYFLPEVSDQYLQRDNSIVNVYQSPFMESGKLELLRYPQIAGDYDQYLRKVIASPTSRDWLLSQQYEKLTVDF